MGVFDKLHGQIGGGDEDAGLSPLDLADLPPNLRKLMRLMIREVELTYAELVEAAASLPGEEPMSQAELDAALDELVRQRWLIRRGEETIIYEVNLRRKAASELAQSIWTLLDSRIAAQRQQRQQAASQEEEA